MRGLDPRIHLLKKRWIAGSSPAMTPDVVCASYDMADASHPLFFVMAGLVPAIHVFFAGYLQRRGWPE